jgi:hypothetical protein
MYRSRPSTRTGATPSVVGDGGGEDLAGYVGLALAGDSVARLRLDLVAL